MVHTFTLPLQLQRNKGKIGETNTAHFMIFHFSSSFLSSTAQLKPWPPPQNPAEFPGGFSTIFFFTL
jgi:hypothetical protein